MTRRATAWRLRRVARASTASAGRADRRRLRADADEGRAALMPYMMGGFPDRGDLAGGRRGLRRRRRRPDRARRPVLRPARRRAGDPRRGDRGARGGGDARLRAGGLRRGLRPGSGGADGLREHGPRARRPERVRRSRSPTAGAAGAIVPDLPLEEARRSRDALARRRAWRWSRWSRRRRRPSAAAQICAARRGLRLRRLDGRRHRRARRASRGARRAGRRRPRPRRRCRSRSASGSAPPSRPPRSAGSPTA